MYAFFDLAGSSNFKYYGPASKKDCENWLEKQQDEFIKEYGRCPFGDVVSNKRALALRWAVSGEPIIKPYPSPDEIPSLEEMRQLLK